MKKYINAKEEPEIVDQCDRLFRNVCLIISGEPYFSSIFALSACLHAVIKRSCPAKLNKESLWNIMQAAEENYNSIIKEGLIEEVTDD